MGQMFSGFAEDVKKFSRRLGFAAGTGPWQEPKRRLLKPPVELQYRKVNKEEPGQ
jgi:hypothetical protein